MPTAATPDLLARLDPGFALASFSEPALAAGRVAVERGRLAAPSPSQTGGGGRRG